VKAIVLCAGPGTRMRPLTDTTPKCMLPVGGKPLLHHTLERLAEAGVTDVAINLHHLPKAIVHDIKRGWQFGLHVTYSYERELLGTAGTIKRLAWWLDDASSALSAGEPFFVVYGDEWTTLDFGKLQSFHMIDSPMATIVTHETEDITGRNQVETARYGKVIRILPKWSSTSVPFGGVVGSGIYVLDALLLPSLDYSDLDNALAAILDRGYHFLFREFRVDADEVIDIGKPEGYARACALAGPSW